MKKSSIQLFHKLFFIIIIIIIICTLAYLFKTYIPIIENLMVCKNEPHGMNCKNCDGNYEDCLKFYIGDSGYLPDYIPYLMQNY
jgi:hypothetical protein